MFWGLTDHHYMPFVLLFTLYLSHQQQGPEVQRFAFFAEWYDTQASILRRYLLFYYSNDDGIELYDTKTNKKVVRRTTLKDINLSDMYVGSTVTILSKRMTLVDFADGFTKNLLCEKLQRTFAMIKPDAMDNMGEILVVMNLHGFRVSRAKMAILNADMAREFYIEHRDKPFYSNLIKYLTSGPVLALELVRENAVQIWRDILGPTDSLKAKEEAPESVRARFGADTTRNAAHGSDSPQAALRELRFFFPDTKEAKMRAPITSARFTNCTCCILKPHVIRDKFLGQIVRDIQMKGFKLTALQMFHMEHVDAAEFYEVYKDVLMEYTSMANHLSSGPCVAIEITSECESTPLAFRDYVGPMDPDVARKLRPDTLRAKYGKDKIQNAIHCTDLPEDGLMEVEYFFKMLQ